MSADEPFSAVEEALRMVLQTYSRQQVLHHVVSFLPKVELEDTPEPGLHGKVEKVSVSLPRELTDAIRARTGRGGFSRYVTEAVQQRFQHDQLSEVLDELEEEYGPIPPEIRAETRKLWPDEQNDEQE